MQVFGDAQCATDAGSNREHHNEDDEQDFNHQTFETFALGS
jgi:hypothetical protein